MKKGSVIIIRIRENKIISIGLNKLGYSLAIHDW